MTTAANDRVARFDGNDVATEFDFDFKVFVNADVRLVFTDVDGADADLVLDSDFSVLLNADQNADPGGVITYPLSGSPLATGEQLTATSVVEASQGASIPNAGGFYSQVVERALDRAMIVIQQLQERIGRGLTLPISVSGTSTELPRPEASTFIGWNALGTALVNYAGVASAAVSSAMAAVVGAATLPLARAALGFSAYFDTLIVAANAAAFRALIGGAASGANADITSGTPFRKRANDNGDFQVWQEGTSFAAMADQTYPADNWKYVKSGAMVHTGSRSTDVPTIAQAGRKILYSLLIDCTTVDAAIAAGDYAAMQTFVEGYNFVNIAGVGLCCQFWHKHTKVGTYCVAFNNSANDRSFIREYTQAVSDTWELATVLVDASPTAGTWDYTNGIGLRVFFTLTAGTTFHTTAGAWQTGNFLATANQVNACDSVANNFMLAGVQLEKGSVATEFDVRTYKEELENCKRYFELTNVAGGSQGNAGGVGDVCRVPAFWTVEKRTTPTLSASLANGVRTNIGSVTGLNPTIYGFGVRITAAAAGEFSTEWERFSGNARF